MNLAQGATYTHCLKVGSPDINSICAYLAVLAVLLVNIIAVSLSVVHRPSHWDRVGMHYAELMSRRHQQVDRDMSTQCPEQDTKVFKVLLEFAEREGIDVMILGNRESKTVAQSMLPGTKKYTSTADNFKARAKCPALVIRPAVRARACRLACKVLLCLSL